jgi:hypothetical protein
MAVKRQLINAGIEPETIPHDWLEASIAAVSKWIQQTEEGVQFVGSLLYFDTQKGNDDKEYRVIDDVNHRIDIVASGNIMFVEGCFVNSRPTPLSHLEISEKPREQCESCGILAHCVPAIPAPASEQLCNHCTVSHEHPRVYERGSNSICTDCPVRTCAHHPEKCRYG